MHSSSYSPDFHSRVTSTLDSTKMLYSWNQPDSTVKLSVGLPLLYFTNRVAPSQPSHFESSSWKIYLHELIYLPLRFFSFPYASVTLMSKGISRFSPAFSATLILKYATAEDSAPTVLKYPSF